MEEKVKFEMPHEVAALDGMEGYERMYSLAYLFSKIEDDPEKARWEQEQLWVQDTFH